MSIRIEKGKTPNWILENDWSLESRVDWAKQIMAFSSRDWSRQDYATPGNPDAEKWALYCLIMNTTKEEALRAWNGFCRDNS